jgi:hypothetical protein
VCSVLCTFKVTQDGRQILKAVLNPRDFSIRLCQLRAEAVSCCDEAKAEPLRALPHCFCQKERLSEMVRIDALAASVSLEYCTTSRSTRIASCCNRWRNACRSAFS